MGMVLTAPSLMAMPQNGDYIVLDSGIYSSTSVYYFSEGMSPNILHEDTLTSSIYIRDGGMDKEGNVILLEGVWDLDTGTGSGRIRRITPTGNAETVVSSSALFRATGIVIDSDENFVVPVEASNENSDNGALLKITKTGEVQTIATQPNAHLAPLCTPARLCIDADGNYVMTELESIYRITPSGAISTVYGSFGNSELSSAQGICQDQSGDFIVADWKSLGDGAIDGAVYRVTDSGIISTIASGAPLVDPMGVALDSNGNILVTDENNPGREGALYSISPAGAVSTVRVGSPFVDPIGVALYRSPARSVEVSVNNRILSRGGILTVDVNAAALNSPFDAWGGIILPNNTLFSFSLQKTILPGAKAIATSVPRLANGYSGNMLATTIPPNVTPGKYKAVVGLFPAGTAPGMNTAIGGYLDEEILEIK